MFFLAHIREVGNTFPFSFQLCGRNEISASLGWRISVCTSVCVQILLMEFLAAFDLVILIVFREQKENYFQIIQCEIHLIKCV